MKRRPKILVADDEEITRIILREVLEREGYNVIEASSGEDVLRLIEVDEEFDLAILDIMMPGIDGFEVLDKLKEKPQTEDVRVIMLSAMNQVDEKVLAFSSGACDYITKPFQREELVARIDTQLTLKFAEEDLMHAKERYEELFEGANELIFTTDANGFLYTVNRRVEELTGYSRENLIGKNFLKLAHPDDREKFYKFWSRIRDGEKPTFELKLRTKTDDLVYVIVSGRAIETVGKVIEIQYNAHDITDRYLSDEKLRESEEKFKILSEQSLLGIIILQDGLVKYVNQALADILEYSIEEMLNWKPYEFSRAVHPDDRSLVLEQEQKKQVGYGNFVTRYQYRLIARSKEVRWVDQYSRTIQYKGRNADFATVIDITEQKKADEVIREKDEELRVLGENLTLFNSNLEEKVSERTTEVEKHLKHKDEFVSQLSQDLRSPLTPLVTILPIVEKQEKDPELKELIGISVENVDLIKELVVKTLSLAKLTSQDIEFNMEDINLSEEVDRVIRIKNRIIEERMIVVENKISKGTIIKADKLRLEELLSNLINNAVNYIDETGGILTIDAEVEDDFATVSIEDTGIGMTDAELSHIFEEFYETDPSTYDLDLLALGLSICKRIVEKHGGKIWCESPGRGKGSTFYFTIPVKSENTYLTVSAV
ncbi:MAG: PAS domain S-box protein [Halobacteriota archaeon]|nr:PAS domain S-box protein [Halobacteriota archaeon]